jgi:pimeloyl-ACP methyl ester carboxylesterase
MNQHNEIPSGMQAAATVFKAVITATAAASQYANSHLIPLLIASSYFGREESRRFWSRTPVENMMAYMKLWNMNLDLMNRAMKGSFQAMDTFVDMEVRKYMPALCSGDPQALLEFAGRMNHLAEQVAYTYPAAIEGIEPEFGFHFERQPASSKVDETDRFMLYQVLPDDPKVSVRWDGKPILIIPPFVLGANILAFLPAEKRSYAHAYANMGIPTYIRTLKDIKAHEAVQVMTPEADARDMQRFCRTIQQRHGTPVTLNGYCQGGFSALCNLLSGELDGLVDAFITCVAPMEGTRSKGLAHFLEELPAQFNDLAYGTKQPPNSHPVADGTLMGWIYKLKSIETEVPLLSMWRDMMFTAHSNGDPSAISKTAAALNYWLIHERNDLPLEITRMSYLSYNRPIAADGTLPVKLFGRELNLKRLAAKNIPWLICYGKQDDLVEPETAMAPLDWVDAEVTAFPKGHVAIATSWSHPESAYALHQRYEKEKMRGPVRFQLDLQMALDATRRDRSKSRRVNPAGSDMNEEMVLLPFIEPTEIMNS